jgi:hypothetical protein
MTNLLAGGPAELDGGAVNATEGVKRDSTYCSGRRPHYANCV